MNAPTWNVAGLIVELLAANGIDTVFGIPGVHNIELYRGLSAAGLRHILVRHEQSAGFAADGFARLTGRPAAAFVISGPGVTNIATALAQAYSDSIPMLVIAATPVRDSLGKHWGVLHELPDQRELAAQVTGLARTAYSAQDVLDHLRAMFASFRAGRARPAYLGVPLDLLAEPTLQRAERFAVGARLPQPAASDIERAVRLLQSARKPLIIAGGGARGAGQVLRQLVVALDGYLVTTSAAKGIVSESHPASLGASLPYGPTRELAAAADVWLAVGTELSETDLYTSLKLARTGRLIRIDIDPAKLADHYAPDVAIQGDARACLEAIAAAVTAHAGWRSEAGPATTYRTAIDAQAGHYWRGCMGAVRALRAALPADAAVFADMTQIAYCGVYAFAADRPGVWFMPSGFGTLGYALPAAIGAKLAQPQRAVVALAGDFGLQFTLAELSTAVELELPLPVIVWNNAALAQIRDDMQRAGIAPLAVVARNPDFQALARACGAEAVQVSDAAQLGSSVQAALGRRGPTLIEIASSAFK